jgi:hypothetical protein
VSAGRVVGWSVSLGVLAVGAAFAGVVSVLNDDTKRRLADSAQLLRDRGTASVVQLRERTVETAQDLRDQWTETALVVRDRWTNTAEEVRSRAVDTAEDWRERSSEGLERRLLQAAEARDASLAALPDDDDSADDDGAEDGSDDVEAAPGRD